MRKPNIELLNIDCLEYLKQCEDKEFDLAIVDPPYGIGFSSKKQANFGKGGIDHKYKNWDNEIPSKEYFEQLKRVSQNQIVWGGNYMTEHLEANRCWLSWYKMQEFSTNEFELAWTSFDKTCKQFNMSRVEAYANINKIHPTEKPVKLYKWILYNFALNGNKVLDTHLGSGSIAVACWDLGFDLVGLEIDKDYYTKAVKRFEQHKKQLTLF